MPRATRGNPRWRFGLVWLTAGVFSEECRFFRFILHPPSFHWDGWPTTQRLHGPRGLPNARDKISAIVKSRRSYTCRSIPQSVKNGAPLPIGGAKGGSMQPDSTDVRSGRLAVCDLAPSAPSTAKWRFGPSKNRHLAPFFTSSLTVFFGFFRKLTQRGANWRELGPEKR